MKELLNLKNLLPDSVIFLRNKQRQVTLFYLKKVIEKEFEKRNLEIDWYSSSKFNSLAKKIFCYFALKYDFSTIEIGKHLKLHYSSVIAAKKSFKELCVYNDIYELKQELEKLIYVRYIKSMQKTGDKSKRINVAVLQEKQPELPLGNSQFFSN